MMFGKPIPDGNGSSPIETFRAWPGAGMMTIAAPSKIRKSRDRPTRPLGLPKHW
jgi:hypothetical protein